MSDKPAKSREGVSNSKDQHPGGSKRTGLLLAGAAALALLIGGGYYLWQNGAPSEVASNDNAVSVAAPYTYDEVTGKDASTATAEKSAALAAPATTDSQTAKDSQSAKKKAHVAAAVPEETIGVSRVSARANTTDELVIKGKRPVWRYAPRADRLSEYYPAYALERGREGEARLHCIIGKKGKLDCERVSETPAKAGFGSAALQVAHRFRHVERLADGRNAIGTPINLRVLFRMPEGERRG